MHDAVGGSYGSRWCGYLVVFFGFVPSIECSLYTIISIVLIAINVFKSNIIGVRIKLTVI